VQKLKEFMQTLVSHALSEKREKEPVICNMLPAALSDVPFHRNTRSITRLFAEQFPVHLAIHEVSLVTAPPAEYTEPHVHHDSDEINILISQQSLWYKILLGATEYVVQNNSCIWIPRGLMHSANVLQGAGYFVTLRLR
jgi:hypothetical protein